MIGQTISQYKILAKIGENAAGILYRAADKKSGRMVDLQALSRGEAANPGIRTRLERANGLQHPNIARIYEFVRSDDIEFAVMEAPEGESAYDFLERERPRRHYLLRYAKQIASALQAAHAAGIVHGPLDTSAMFISPGNDIKLHRFGFAPLGSPPASEEDRKSVFGASAPYVSPEQVNGATADIRSDIFSFGALLYHMTTGRRAFRGATIADIWTAILAQEPTPVTRLTSRTPPGMDKLLDRCLPKDPQRRFQQVDEILPLLDKMAEALHENPEQTVSFFVRYRVRIAKIAVISLAATAAAAATVFWWRSRPVPEPVIGKQLRQLTKDSGYDTDPAMSADGTQLAYASDRTSDGNLDIWVQPAEGGQPRRLTSDPADDIEPAFSPDGGTIAFRSDRNGGGVYLVSVSGGEARLIAPEGRRPRYSPDGRWIAYWMGPPDFSAKAEGGYKTFVIPSNGGAPRQIRPDFASCTYPIWSPDGKSLLIFGWPDATGSLPDWWIASVEGSQLQNVGACRLFHRQGALPDNKYGIPGDWKGNHVYFSIAASEVSNIWRAEIAGGTVSTKPLKVTSSAETDTKPSSTLGGRAVFGRQLFNADIWGIPVAANEGKVTGALKRWTTDPGIDSAPSLSADGSKLLFQSNRSGHYGLWLRDVSSGKESPVAPVPREQLWPLISPDGTKVSYSEPRIRRYEHFYRPTAGGPSELLCEDCGPAMSGWSHDSAMVLIDSVSGAYRPSVSLIRLSDRRKTILLEAPQYDLHQASFSPDDRSIAFAAGMDGGGSRLFVTTFTDRPPFPPKEWIALTDGTSWATNPRWSPDGKLVYFTSTRDGNRCIWAQRLDAGNRPSGPAFGVYHFHTVRRAPAQLAFGSMDLFVGHDQLLVSLGELTGNIWSAKVSD